MMNFSRPPTRLNTTVEVMEAKEEREALRDEVACRMLSEEDLEDCDSYLDLGDGQTSVLWVHMVGRAPAFEGSMWQTRVPSS